MSDIVQEEVAIKNVGNPMELHLKTKYKVKAVGKEQVIDSTVLVHMTDASDGARITRVEDKWGGTPPPDGFFSKVCLAYFGIFFYDNGRKHASALLCIGLLTCRCA